MQKSSIIKLIKPNISQSAIDAVVQVLESGMLVNGPVVGKLERELAEYLDMPYAVCVSSGTAALHLSLLACDINPGDEVIVPAFTFPATANAVEMVGAMPVFIDCEPGGVNLNTGLIERHINSRTRAIMPVHAFGIPADMDEILSIASRHNLIVIEDAACALGSRLKEKHCGSFGDMATFSFHPRKLLTTGEGGAVVTYDKKTAELIRSLRNHGWDKGDYNHLGYNYRMTDIQAALGVDQIKSFDKYISARRHIARTYGQSLKSVEWLKPIPVMDDSYWNVQTLLYKVSSEFNRDELITFLRREQIETTIGTYCVPLIKYYREKYGYTPDEFPSAIEIANQTISFPLWNKLGESEIERLLFALYKYSSKKQEVVV